MCRSIAATGIFAALALACVATTPSEDSLPAHESGARSDPVAVQAIDRWFAQTFGFDALEAYELVGFPTRVGFGLARKWEGAEVKLLTYVVEPRALDELGHLIFVRPGRAPEILRYNTPQLYGLRRGERSLFIPRIGQVVRVPGFSPGVGGPDPYAIAGLVSLPPLSADFVHRTLGVEEIDGEACVLVESRPRKPSRWLTSVRRALSERTGAALRTNFHRGEHEVFRVDVRTDQVELYGERWLPTRRRISSDGVDVAELVLRNQLADTEIPDDLFTIRSLEAHRYPSF